MCQHIGNPYLQFQYQHNRLPWIWNCCKIFWIKLIQEVIRWTMKPWEKWPSNIICKTNPQHRFIVTWGDPKNGFSNGFVDYQSGDPNWYHDPVPSTSQHPNQTSPEMRQLIINIRTQLEEHPYAQIGTSAITGNLKNSVLHPLQIARLIELLNDKASSKKTPYTPKGSIPLFQRAFGINHIHQADLLGPRYIRRWAFPFAQCYRIARATEFFSIPNEGKTTRP